ncbi:alpha/beta fold hydrolase [Bradyrhizobium genosp. P]|uniref:alpha/beta fold hydrolase n=1 Tax=Bradyrhizobium genosp. P TaxID=83641 RepID=UPI003CEE1011
MRTIDANSTATTYARTGEGPPLLLLHGAEADHSMFDALAPLLAPRFTVIAYDQRDSGGTQNPASPYGFDDLADDAAALIAALGHPRAHVFGTSFGGAIAQVLAARHPERVDRLILSSTFRVGVPLSSINPEGFPRFAELRSRLPETLHEFAEYFFPRDHIADHPEVLAVFTENRRDAGQRQRRAAVLQKPIAVDLSAIAAATLVTVGAEDRLIPPAHTLALAKDIRDARTVVIPGTGHVGTIQNPLAVATAVQAFLQGERPNIK